MDLSDLSSLAAAALDGHFEHPAGSSLLIPHSPTIVFQKLPKSFFTSVLDVTEEFHASMQTRPAATKMVLITNDPI
jgi:hypothetical protein